MHHLQDFWNNVFHYQVVQQKRKTPLPFVICTLRKYKHLKCAMSIPPPTFIVPKTKLLIFYNNLTYDISSTMFMSYHYPWHYVPCQMCISHAHPQHDHSPYHAPMSQVYVSFPPPMSIPQIVLCSKCACLMPIVHMSIPHIMSHMMNVHVSFPTHMFMFHPPPMCPCIMPHWYVHVSCPTDMSIFHFMFMSHPAPTPACLYFMPHLNVHTSFHVHVSSCNHTHMSIFHAPPKCPYLIPCSCLILHPLPHVYISCPA